MTAAGGLPTGTVTFLFTDIEGSTRLSQAVGDAFATVIDRHHAVMREAFASCGGVVVSTEGDAFFAVFTHARQAVIGTARAQRALAAEVWPGGVDVRVRMGLHTGDGRLGGDDYAGIEVNRAARVSDAAHGGQVLLSGSTVSALEGDLPEGVGIRDLGEIVLRDIDEPMAVSQLDIEGLQAGFPPLRAGRPGWLPEPLTSFLGRGPELTDIAGHLERSRLVTLTGPGGTGKTRLSIEAARAALPRFPGGAWFVPVESITDPELVLPEIAQRLGVAEDPHRPIAASIADHIGAKRTLVVLDNLEQVVAVGPLLRDLLERAPGLRILGSSREPLRVSGDQEYPVSVLDEEMATLLFAERARRVRPDLDVGGENDAHIRRIVRWLDALPLAIELAAARVRLFPPIRLAERLETGLGELASGNRDLPERQRTMRGAIDWSYRLLDDVERAVLARLAVFRGGADLTSVEDVIDPDGTFGSDVVEGVLALADKSLVIVEDGPAGEPRVRLLESIRAYAAERLADDPDAEDVLERHARRYRDLAEAIEPELTGDAPGPAFVRLELDHDNLRAVLDRALARGDPADGLRIGGAIWRYWQQRAHMAEGRERMEALLALPDASADPCAHARGSTALGGMAYWQGDHRAANTAYEAALDGYRRCGDRAGEARALFDLSYPVAILGDVDTALRLGRESLAIHTELEDEKGIGEVKESQAVMAVMAGDYERARTIQEDVVEIHARIAGAFKRSDSIGLLAIIEALLGDAANARKHAIAGFRIQLDLRDESGYAGGLQVEALVALAEDRPEHAALVSGVLQGMRDRGARVLVPSETLNLRDPAEIARERLGERFAAYFEEGRRLSPKEAFERAPLGEPAETATDR